jgi:aspartate/methionine/tyrosine aminotransferase
LETTLPPKSPHNRKDLGNINPFRVMTVMQRAAELEAEGRKIVHMEVGEPDFNTAQPIIEAAKAALDAGLTQYTSAPGIDELRDCLVLHYRSRYGVEVARERILITPGASGGLSLLANLLISPGDGVLLSDPAYPCVRNFIQLMAAHPQPVPVEMHDNFQPSPAQLDAVRDASTSGVWLASPNNPTGAIMNRDQLAEVCGWARRQGLHVLVDEIYHGLHYVEDLPSVLEVDDSAYVVNSFSKYFGMTGWRLGWIIVPTHAIEKRIFWLKIFIFLPHLSLSTQRSQDFREMPAKYWSKDARRFEKGAIFSAPPSKTLG